MVVSRTQSILIVGVGGLGVPALMTLTRGGAESVILADPDPVELSNLPRQVIYRESDIGLAKVDAASRWVAANVPAIKVETHRGLLDASNASELIRRTGFVIDAVDNPATKFLINDECVALGVPFVYGGVLGMTGQAMTVIPRRSACLRCLFEEPPGEDDSASCRDAGIIGPVAGAIGTAQATEALRWLHGEEPELAGRMLTYDAQSPRVRITEISMRPDCKCNLRCGREAAGVRLE